MKTIILGEKQPVPCKECGFVGYAVHDYMKARYTMCFTQNGEYDYGRYSDYQPYITKAKTPYCANCGKKLQFKINRDSEIILKDKIE